MKANLFKSVKHTSPSLTRSVSFFLDRIRDGKSKDTVQAIRNAANPDEQDRLKLQLPVVAFNGTFTKRGIKGLKEPSGLMVLDFDTFTDLEESALFKSTLKDDQHIFAAWFSPRKGVKALYRIKTVEDDAEFKQIYEAVADIYTNLDQSGKDISRLCFESYDPDVYINLNAVEFIPEVVHEKELSRISVPTNIPITDENEIAQRVLTWWQRKYMDSNNRNTSVYILARALNRFGVHKSVAYRHGFDFAQFTGLPEKEVTAAVNSAYKNTQDFGTAHFEDSARKKQMYAMVASGRSDKEIKKAYKDIKPERVSQELSIARKEVDVSKFWKITPDAKINIEPFSFKVFLEGNEFFKYYPDKDSKTFVFITKDDNFIDTTSEYHIKDFVLNNLEERHKIDVYNVAAKQSKLFSYDFLSILKTADIELEKDTKDFAMLYYQNTAIKVTKNKVIKIPYNDLKGYVWKKNIIKRNFKDVNHHPAEYRKFVWLISGEDVERYESFQSIIGYLLHSHKNTANNRAIILNDEKISDFPSGGSGKGLFTKALGHIKNVTSIDGKQFKFDNSFPYQTVSADCQVLTFDDVKRSFKFENLFSLITEGITLEYKNEQAIRLPVEESPKILITTNYTIQARGDSFERRMFEIELANHFNANHTPADEFGHMLFDDWDEVEWQRFDRYMINCLQKYLRSGLKQYEHINLDIRKLVNETNQDFIDFMEDESLFNGKRINYKELRDKFTSDYTDYISERWFTQRLFNKWLTLYLEYKGFEYKSISSGGFRMYELFNGSSEQSAPEDESPF